MLYFEKLGHNQLISPKEKCFLLLYIITTPLISPLQYSCRCNPSQNKSCCSPGAHWKAFWETKEITNWSRWRKLKVSGCSKKHNTSHQCISTHIMIMCADVYLQRKVKHHTHNLIHLTVIRFHVDLLIKQSERRLSQALRVSLGAEYIMQRSTWILYGQINPTSPRASLPPCLFTPSSIIWNMVQERKREAFHISWTTGNKRHSGDERSERSSQQEKGSHMEKW